MNNFWTCMNKIYIDIPVFNHINKRALIRYQDPTYYSV